MDENMGLFTNQQAVPNLLLFSLIKYSSLLRELLLKKSLMYKFPQYITIFFLYKFFFPVAFLLIFSNLQLMLDICSVRNFKVMYLNLFDRILVMCLVPFPPKIKQMRHNFTRGKTGNKHPKKQVSVQGRFHSHSTRQKSDGNKI